jgi:hypothetical protein
MTEEKSKLHAEAYARGVTLKKKKSSQFYYTDGRIY